MQLAKRLHGDEAVKHLNDIRTNNCFMHTGICPDDPDDFMESPHYTRVEYIHAVSPEQKDILRYDTPGITLVEIHGYAHIVVYTDGSLINPKSEHFVQAGWGMYVGPGHINNYQSPLLSNAPTGVSGRVACSLSMPLCVSPARLSYALIVREYTIYVKQSSMAKNMIGSTMTRIYLSKLPRSTNRTHSIGSSSGCPLTSTRRRTWLKN